MHEGFGTTYFSNQRKPHDIIRRVSTFRHDMLLMSEARSLEILILF